jgi:hypothetical protein
MLFLILQVARMRKFSYSLLAAHENFFVTNDEKYQTCLIFGLHVTNDAHEEILSIQLVTNNKYARTTSALVCGGLKV